MKTLILALALTTSVSVFAETCPVGPKEDHLIIGRVMRNFGKYTRDADGVVIKARMWPEDITDAEMTTAASKIPTAIACVDLIIAKPDGDLAPQALNELQGALRDQYLQHYLEYMKQLRADFVTYKKLLEDLVATPKAQRKFDKLIEHYQKMDNFITEAHNHMGGG